MENMEQTASKYWEEISENYKKLRKEKFGRALTFHHVTSISSIVFAFASLFMVILAICFKAENIKHPLIIMTFVFLGLAIILCIVTTCISHFKIDEGESPELWIQAIKKYVDEHKEDENGYRTESEILVILHEKFKLPNSKIKRGKRVKIVSSLIICFIIPIIEEYFIFPEINIGFKIFNLIIVFLFGKYIDKIEDVYLKLTSSDVLYERMKRETLLQMIKDMRVNKAK